MDTEVLGGDNLENVMKSYIEEVIKYFDEEVSTKLSSPATKNLHTVNLY